MIELKEHLQAMSNLHNTIEEMRVLAETLPESTEKGYLLARIDIMQTTAEDYTENTVGLYDDVLNFAMVAAL